MAELPALRRAGRTRGRRAARSSGWAAAGATCRPDLDADPAAPVGFVTDDHGAGIGHRGDLGRTHLRSPHATHRRHTARVASCRWPLGAARDARHRACPRQRRRPSLDQVRGLDVGHGPAVLVDQQPTAVDRGQPLGHGPEGQPAVEGQPRASHHLPIIAGRGRPDALPVLLAPVHRKRPGWTQSQTRPAWLTGDVAGARRPRRRAARTGAPSRRGSGGRRRGRPSRELVTTELRLRRASGNWPPPRPAGARWRRWRPTPPGRARRHAPRPRRLRPPAAPDGVEATPPRALLTARDTRRGPRSMT